MSLNGQVGRSTHGSRTHAKLQAYLLFNYDKVAFYFATIKV